VRGEGIGGQSVSGRLPIERDPREGQGKSRNGESEERSRLIWGKGLLASLVQRHNSERSQSVKWPLQKTKKKKKKKETTI